MRKILVPIDMSETSEEALAFAVSCPCLENRELLLLHVIDPLDISSLGVLGMVDREDDMRRELKKEARAHLDDLVQRCRRDGLELSSRIVVDRPWRGIINTAIEENVDAIVMGSHGRGLVAEQLLGSVAKRVVRKAPAPVTIIRPEHMREDLIRRWHHLGGN